MSKAKVPPTSANAWWEFETFVYRDDIEVMIPICGLCGNSGYIDTRGGNTECLNQRCGILAFCICPNGRKLKKIKTGQKKWGGDSVIQGEHKKFKF